MILFKPGVNTNVDAGCSTQMGIKLSNNGSGIG